MSLSTGPLELNALCGVQSGSGYLARLVGNRRFSGSRQAEPEYALHGAEAPHHPDAIGADRPRPSQAFGGHGRASPRLSQKH